MCVCGVFVQATSDWSERSVYKLCCFFGMQATRPGGIGLRAWAICLPACLSVQECACVCVLCAPWPKHEIACFSGAEF